MTAHTAASDMDYDVETGNETPDPRLAEEEYRARRDAELAEWVRSRNANMSKVFDYLAVAVQYHERQHPQSWGSEGAVFLRVYIEEFGLSSTLRALASALEPPQ
jgi:hypothetical protein